LLQLKEIRTASLGATPEALLHKIEEETKVNTYIVTQKLPKEIEQRRMTVESLERIISQPALGRDDINQLREQVSMFKHFFHCNYATFGIT
jgi:intraflagellar transport protein 81